MRVTTCTPAHTGPDFKCKKNEVNNKFHYVGNDWHDWTIIHHYRVFMNPWTCRFLHCGRALIDRYVCSSRNGKESKTNFVWRQHKLHHAYNFIFSSIKLGIEIMKSYFFWCNTALHRKIVNLFLWLYIAWVALQHSIYKYLSGVNEFWSFYERRLSCEAEMNSLPTFLLYTVYIYIIWLWNIYLK